MRAQLFSYASPEWRTARAAAVKRALYRCANCGKNVAGYKKARVDHITPVRENPARALDPSNLRVLCIRCDAARHAEKGHRNVERVAIGLDGYPET